MVPAIEFKNVSKQFVLHHDRPRSIQEMVMSLFRRNGNSSREKFWALKDVSFAVEPGEMLGIIGSNGSGKSTALKLMSRLLKPTRGEVIVNGKVSALLELGAGFNQELTGLENIYLNGSILGFSKAQMDELREDIIKFSELHRFIDIPLKRYSSGMIIRLGFAIAINVNPDILLTDEVLAVGDEEFQMKCLEKIEDLRCRGKTIIFVSHGMDNVRKFCDRAVWIEKGVVRASGETNDVVDQYMTQVKSHFLKDVTSSNTTDDQKCSNSSFDWEKKIKVMIETRRLIPAWTKTSDSRTRQRMLHRAALRKRLKENNGIAVRLESRRVIHIQEGRWGSREIEISDVQILNAAHQSCRVFQTDQPFIARICYKAHQPIANPVFGIAIHDQRRLLVSGPNTKHCKVETETIKGCGTVDFAIDHLPLLKGKYTLSVSIYDDSLTHAYDHQHRAYWFCTEPGRMGDLIGSFYIPCHWQINANEGKQAER